MSDDIWGPVLTPRSNTTQILGANQPSWTKNGAVGDIIGGFLPVLLLLVENQ